jgi:hypothetical protein
MPTCFDLSAELLPQHSMQVVQPATANIHASATASQRTNKLERKFIPTV